jgi:hypothetical protein
MAKKNGLIFVMTKTLCRYSEFVTYRKTNPNWNGGQKQTEKPKIFNTGNALKEKRQECTQLSSAFLETFCMVPKQQIPFRDHIYIF